MQSQKPGGLDFTDTNASFYVLKQQQEMVHKMGQDCWALTVQSITDLEKNTQSHHHGYKLQPLHVHTNTITHQHRQVTALSHTGQQHHGKKCLLKSPPSSSKQNPQGQNSPC